MEDYVLAITHYKRECIRRPCFSNANERDRPNGKGVPVKSEHGSIKHGRVGLRNGQRTTSALCQVNAKLPDSPDSTFS